jgi:hypothetical protein
MDSFGSFCHYLVKKVLKLRCMWFKKKFFFQLLPYSVGVFKLHIYYIQKYFSGSFHTKQK